MTGTGNSKGGKCENKLQEYKLVANLSSPVSALPYWGFSTKRCIFR
jgi:hypothetical protein